GGILHSHLLCAFRALCVPASADDSTCTNYALKVNITFRKYKLQHDSDSQHSTRARCLLSCRKLVFPDRLDGASIPQEYLDSGAASLQSAECVYSNRLSVHHNALQE
ncbi:hypothetical protein PENTCL1PPCAC_14178, partial [Pristionchus entomophagus]